MTLPLFRLVELNVEVARLFAQLQMEPHCAPEIAQRLDMIEAEVEESQNVLRIAE
jgi:biotin operon repressor